MARRRQVTYSKRPNHAARQAHARGDRQFRTYDTSYIQPKHAVGPTIGAIIIGLAAVAIIIFAIGSCTKGCTPVDANLAQEGTQVPIVITEGETVSSIAQSLKDGGLISDMKEFTKTVQDSGAEAQLKPGTYKVIAGTSVDDIVSQLKAGPIVEQFTVPEGYTINKVASAVEQAYGGKITADEFKQACSKASDYEADYPFLKGAYNNSLEGFLFPKTYEMDEDDTADTVVRKMLTQYADEISTLDYTYAESKGLSPYDVLILASVIEREATSDNRSTVASVFYNRLAIDMSLQSDATVAYVIDGDPTPEDLQIDSPYNTYLNPGLPAGPICSPGLESLKAACKPDSTDYLYFYFTPNDDGSMNYYFSETYEEHQDAIGVPSSSSEAA